MTKEIYDLVIIGASAAGLSAAVYARRRRLNFLVVASDVGGEMALSGEIENWPGVIHTTGIELTDEFLKQAKANNIPIKEGIKIAEIKREGNIFLINGYKAKTVIITSGVHPRELGVAGEKELRAKGLSYCTVCLPPESTIVANSEPKAIDEVKVNDLVLTSDGTYQPVLKTMKRSYSGELIQVQSRFFLEENVLLTPNHPVLVTTLTKGKGKDYHHFKWGKPEWLPAEFLTKNHILVYPITKVSRDTPSITISKLLDVPTDKDYAATPAWSPTAVLVPNRIPIEKDFLRLVGYYLAEGSVNGYQLAFYFGKQEQQYVRDVVHLLKKYFDVKVHTRIVGSVSRIEVYSTLVAQLFQTLFHTRSHQKSLPHWVTVLPIRKQRELIRGLWRGDGCQRYKDFVLVTNSRILTNQVKNILLRLGIVPSVRKIGLDKLKPSIVAGRKIHFRHPKYEITVGGPWLEPMAELLGVDHPRVRKRKRVCYHAHIRNGMVFLPIRKISRIYYRGPVFNLGVAKNHSYVTINSAVHNCDGPLFPGKVVATIGGGNSVLESAIMMAEIASKVYVINKNPQFKGDDVLIDKVANELTKKNVEVIYKALTTRILGDGFVSGVEYKDEAGDLKTIKADGVFVHIGMIPNSNIAPKEVEKNEYGEIKVDIASRTNVPGFFAAGDVTNVPYKQLAIAAGQGVAAALSAVDYLNKYSSASPD